MELYFGLGEFKVIGKSDAVFAGYHDDKNIQVGTCFSSEVQRSHDQAKNKHMYINIR